MNKNRIPEGWGQAPPLRVGATFMVARLKRLLILIVLLSQGYSLSASTLEDIYYVGEMPSSQAIGRGGAYVGVGGSAFAAYWNPAGLVSLKQKKLGISSNLYSVSDNEIGDIIKRYPLQSGKINFISVCGPEVGIYFRSLSNRIDKTKLNADDWRKKDVKVNIFGLTVAVPHAEKVDFGMNINFIFGTLGLAEVINSTPLAKVDYGYGWGLDWGLIYKASEELNIGLSLLNGPGIVYWRDSDNDRLPPVMRVGVNMQLSELMSIGIDYKKGFYDDSIDDSEITHIGIEHYLSSNFIIRGGIYGNNFDDKYKTSYSAGLGYRKGNYILDIAARQFFVNNTVVRRFSISSEIMF